MWTNVAGTHTQWMFVFGRRRREICTYCLPKSNAIKSFALIFHLNQHNSHAQRRAIGGRFSLVYRIDGTTLVLVPGTAYNSRLVRDQKNRVALAINWIWDSYPYFIMEKSEVKLQGEKESTRLTAARCKISYSWTKHASLALLEQNRRKKNYFISLSIRLTIRSVFARRKSRKCLRFECPDPMTINN